MSDVAVPGSSQADFVNKADLNRAAEALRKGELVQAEQLLEQLLSAHPEQPEVLHLLGALRRLQGRGLEAEPLYRKSIELDAHSPDGHYGLGTLLYALRRPEEAITPLNEAIRLKPNLVEAYLNLGLAHYDLKQLDLAERALRQGLRLQPNQLILKQALSAVLNDEGRAKDAEAILRPAISAAGRDPRQAASLINNLGISLNLQRRYPEALQALERAQQLVPDLAYADYNRATVLQHLGRTDEAIEAYRMAIARNPLDVRAHADLNRLLYRLERNEDFLRSYEEAGFLYPEAGLLWLDKAKFLFQAGDYVAAREAYERATPLLPAHVTPHDGLALIHARMGEFAEAIHEHEIVVAMEPENAHAWVNFAETLIRAGDAEKALSAAERAMAIAPENQHALGMWGLALRSQGDERDEWLNDYEQFVQIFEIEPPDGYSDLESFNGDLNTYLDRLHRDKREYLDQTLRGGTQTIDNIFGAGHNPVEALRAQIDKAVSAYIAGMKADDRHPLLRRRNPLFRYAGSWSSRLRDCGFHTNHVHPKGWISSAYYISLPDTVEQEAEKQGWIKFGEPAFDAGFSQPVRRAIKPVAGTLVLFPSYMWHGTVPFHSPKARTTIAFDVVPGT